MPGNIYTTYLIYVSNCNSDMEEFFDGTNMNDILAIYDEVIEHINDAVKTNQLTQSEGSNLINELIDPRTNPEILRNNLCIF